MESVRTNMRALGTTLEITVNCQEGEVRKTEAAISDFFREIRNFENRFSRFLPESEVWNANGNLWKTVRVSKEFLRLWDFCEGVRKESYWYFDARIEPLLSSWGYASDPVFASGRDVFEVDAPPSPELSDSDFFVESRLDFWGVGKGAVLDLAKERFEAFPNVCFSAGGDVFAKGEHVSWKNFAIALEHPLDPSLAIGEIRMETPGFVAGSSANRRSWGTSHSHVVDPILKTSARNMLANFTYAGDGMTADAWSTAYFAMGFEKAKRASQEGRGPECLLVSIDGTLYVSPGFPGKTYS